MKKPRFVTKWLLVASALALISCSEKGGQKVVGNKTVEVESSQSSNEQTLGKLAIREPLGGKFVAWGLESKTLAKGLIPFRFLELPDLDKLSGTLDLFFGYSLKGELGTITGTLTYEDKEGLTTSTSARRAFQRMSFTPFTIPQENRSGPLRKKSYACFQEEGDSGSPLEFELVAYFGDCVEDFEKNVLVSPSVPLWVWKQQLVAPKIRK